MEKSTYWKSFNAELVSPSELVDCQSSVKSVQKQREILFSLTFWSSSFLLQRLTNFLFYRDAGTTAYYSILTKFLNEGKRFEFDGFLVFPETRMSCLCFNVALFRKYNHRVFLPFANFRYFMLCMSDAGVKNGWLSLDRTGGSDFCSCQKTIGSCMLSIHFVCSPSKEFSWQIFVVTISRHALKNKFHHTNCQKLTNTL